MIVIKDDVTVNQISKVALYPEDGLFPRDGLHPIDNEIIGNYIYIYDSVNYSTWELKEDVVWKRLTITEDVQINL